jgi:DNA-binding transcriptional LysR family regulator
VFVRPEAQGLLQHIEQMDQHASSLDEMIAEGASKVVRIATMEGLASGYIARRVPALARFDPGIRIELVSNPQVVDLNRKEADIFLSFFNPATRGLRSTLVGNFSLFLYCSKDYLARRGRPRRRTDLTKHVFVGYVDDLLAIDAVRWLDEVIMTPRFSFQSNSVFAQRNAALQGMGIVLLPTFVASGVDGLERILDDEVSIRRDVWVSARTEHGHLARIKSVMAFLKHIFARDVDFLCGKTDVISDG